MTSQQSTDIPHISKSVQPEAQIPGHGLYSRLQTHSGNQRLCFSDVHHCMRIMPTTSYKLDGIPLNINETSAVILKESAEDLGRNDKIGHAVLVTIKKVAELKYSLELFDSTNKSMSHSVRKQLCHMLPLGSSIEVCCVQVQDQGKTNDTDCGYFVLAFMTHICLGLREELDTIVFDVSKMRGHLKECCENCSLTEFPTVRDENNQKVRRSENIKQ